MTSFWRGELVWASAPISMPAADIFYWVSSLVLVILSVIGFRRFAGVSSAKHVLVCISGSFVSLVLFLAMLSVSFNFGVCFYPSSFFPFFVSGRLISAAIIPFLLLYVLGLNWAFGWIKKVNLQFIVLIAIVLFITVSEIIISLPVFASEYNFFHL